MRFDWLALAWLTGLTLAQCQAHLPDTQVLLGLGMVAIVVGGLGVRRLNAVSAQAQDPWTHSPVLRSYSGHPDWSFKRERWFNALTVALLLVVAGVLGFVWASTLAHTRMQSRFPTELDNTEHLLRFDVTGLPIQSGSAMGTSVRVAIRILEPGPDSNSDHLISDGAILKDALQGVMLTWPGACIRDCERIIVPGQRWQARLRLRMPHGPLNDSGLDTQARMLQQGVSVTAQVRGHASYLGQAEGFSLRMHLARWRQQIANRMMQAMPGGEFAGVLVALSIGDQQGIAPGQWEWFSRTGMSHLVAISGTHVSLLASLVGLLACVVVRRVCWRTSAADDGWVRCPSTTIALRVIFAIAGTLSALVYCLFAGWGIPAQRTFYMLACAGLAVVARWRLSARDGLALALVILTAIDPWSVLTGGLWLSFAAVATLMVFTKSQTDAVCAVPDLHSGDLYDARRSGDTQGHVHQVESWSQDWREWPSGHARTVWMTMKQWRCWSYFRTALGLQLIVTLATLPWVAAQFNGVSLVSLPANLWAVPWVSLALTPAALMLAVLAGLGLPHPLLQGLALPVQGLAWVALAPTRWLAQWPEAVMEVAGAPGWLVALSLAGVLIALTAPPFRGRWLAWTLVLPQLAWTPDGPVAGGWRLHAFDVGQGSAILVQTSNHNVLFDTGWRHGHSDAVRRMVLPELKALGVRFIDDVVISHPDLDHVGGLDTLLQSRQVGQLRGSGLAPRSYVACQAGQRWEYDGVEFSFVAPTGNCSSSMLVGLERNRCSCVLLVKGVWHRALLPGDIDGQVERSILGLGVDLDVKESGTSSKRSQRNRPAKRSRRRVKQKVRQELAGLPSEQPSAQPSEERTSTRSDRQPESRARARSRRASTNGLNKGANKGSKKDSKRRSKAQSKSRTRLDTEARQINGSFVAHPSSEPSSVAIAEPALPRTPVDWLPVDVVLMAHHGSISSSVPVWVKALAPAHAIAQAGHHNQFGHPHPKVIARWCEQGARVWSSPEHGSVRVESGPDGLDVVYARALRRRYWHNALPRLRRSDPQGHPDEQGRHASHARDDASTTGASAREINQDGGQPDVEGGHAIDACMTGQSMLSRRGL